MRRQVFARGRQMKIGLVEHRFTDEQFEEARAFEPPMTEQLRVEGEDNDWIDIGGGKLTKLHTTLFEKMCGMSIGGLFGRDPIVEFLFLTATSDPVIFHAGKFPNASGNRTEMLEWKI